MKDENKNSLKRSFAALVGTAALVYLGNPTAGFLEFIPDNLPVVGNLDEAIASVLLVSAIKTLKGWDLSDLLGGRSKKNQFED